MDHMGGMGSYGTGYGTSLDVFFGVLLTVLVKLLFLVLVAAVIIGVLVWVRNTFFKNTALNAQSITQAVNKDPIVKTAVAAAAVLLGIVLILSLFGGFGGTGTHYGMNDGMMNMGGYYGFNSALSITGLVQLLVKVLSITLVVALIMALAAYIKKLYDQGAFRTPSGTPFGNASQDQQNTQSNQNEQ